MSHPDIEEMKNWFGDGEWDVGLMLRLGVLTEEKLVEICKALVGSPWYDPEAN